MKTENQLFRVIFFASLIFTMLSCAEKKENNSRITYDLSGRWQYRADSLRTGIQDRWFYECFLDSAILPGTLDENKKGLLNHDTTDQRLNREYKYYGAAWFKKEINIPASWIGKHIEFIMERTKVTQVWLDTFYMGSNNNILSPQVYDLTDILTPGLHMLNVMVDNDIKLVPVEGSHAYEENTQTNWNGILGKLCLQITNDIRINSVKTIPDIQNNTVKVRLKTVRAGKTPINGSIELQAELWNSSKKQNLKVKSFPVVLNTSENDFELNYELGKNAQQWSEFNPNLYRLHITLYADGKVLDNLYVDFGLREFNTIGTHFGINGLKTFLRGKQDGCVFPLTGHPPMDTSGWLRVFRIAKSYGINHYRFHSWCPPEAAFKAADICGIYLQPELPIWYAFNAHDSSQLAFMMKEGYNMLNNYGNHASFVMMALGNEIHQDRQVLKQMVSDFRKYDNRPLYAQGSNNFLGNPSLAEGDDYWTTFRTGREKPDCSTDVRASASFLDSREGGILNTFYPSTDRTYSKAIDSVPVPVIGHEIGQYQVYPDYNEIPKYTGILKPWNIEIFRKRLAEKGMLDQADDFFHASGKLSAICYRDEIELAMRTPGFGGFQLLDLQDYPGQGTALVGMLDAFMDSKGLITPEEFRQFCNGVVILVKMEKYCWTNNESFSAEICIANFGPTSLDNKKVNWKLTNQNNDVYYTGSIIANDIPQGEITTIEKIDLNLNKIDHALKTIFDVHIEGTDYATRYPVWIYPSGMSVNIPEGIVVSHLLSKDILEKLQEGANVLLFPDFKANEMNSIEGMYITEFWNWEMFKKFSDARNKKPSPGTLGILTNPDHVLFNEFPTEFHSNRQWWAIVKNSRPIILDDAPKGYKPIVQVIDNISRNHKLGLIFEFKVGKGNLLVCASNLQAITDKAEANQLYASILNYMNSNDFNPQTEISAALLKKMVK